MNYVHFYGWLFATLLFVLAIQLAPTAITGQATFTPPSAGENNTPWMGLFVILALALAVTYARYKHFIQSHH